ncbi:hypothetical protein GCM10009851_33040 [Herbiconiux moechotypicola]|uniref:Uncharacterized protein n=1 Tax=Herbiconiux moechotypicola TaxID=637393 RepID=A0ABP5QVF4_9MICO
MNVRSRIAQEEGGGLRPGRPMTPHSLVTRSLKEMPLELVHLCPVKIKISYAIDRAHQITSRRQTVPEELGEVRRDIPCPRRYRERRHGNVR